MKLVNKPIGKTPLEAVHKLKEVYPELQDTKLAYAGRLDPLADGLLIVLESEECKNRDYFQDLTKEYIFEILLGVSTDSYDLMGVILSNIANIPNEVPIEKMRSIVETYKGEWLMEYPPYCAKPIDGKPMYSLARSGKLDMSNLPTKNVVISDIEILSSKLITTEAILRKIVQYIPAIKGDFRQDKIVQLWKDHLAELDSKSLQTFKIRVNVSSGTYIRSLATSIGAKLNIPSLAYGITRTKVGNYNLDDALDIF